MMDDYQRGYDAAQHHYSREIIGLRAQLTTLQAKLEAAEKDAATGLTKAIYAEAKEWKGDNRSPVFLALADIANRMGLSLTTNDLWDAAMQNGKE